MSGKTRGSLKTFLPKVRSLKAPIFPSSPKPPQDEEYDQETIDKYMQYASDATRARYEKAKSEGKNNIVNNVINKYKPVVDGLESGGIFALIDQLAECKIQPESTMPSSTMDTSTMDTTPGGGRRKKMRGGDLPAVKAALKKLWVEIVTATFTPDNVMKGVPLAAIGIANPSVAGMAFSGVKSLLGFASSMCLTSTGITALSIGALLLLYDVKFDLDNFKLPNLNQAQLDQLKTLKDELKKNLKPGGKYGSVAKPPADLLKKVEQIKADQLKATEIITKLNTISNEAGVKAESAMPTDVPHSTPIAVPDTTTKTAAPDTLMKTGSGRRTKKRGVKRRKTRRGIRKPLFKY